MTPEGKPQSPTRLDAGPSQRKPYSSPRVRSAPLYERAKLACTFDEFDQVWIGSTS